MSLHEMDSSSGQYNAVSAHFAGGDITLTAALARSRELAREAEDLPSVGLVCCPPRANPSIRRSPKGVGSHDPTYGVERLAGSLAARRADRRDRLCK